METRFLVIFDKELKTYQCLETDWTNEELEFRWIVVSEHKDKEEARIAANKMNMLNDATINEVTRISDSKTFKLGQTVTSDGGLFRGVIDGFNQFQDGMRVHVDVDEDSNDRQYFSISELD